MAFDWTSLIKPATALGSNIASNALFPAPATVNANTNKQNTAFTQGATINQLGNAQNNTGFNQSLALNGLNNQQQVRRNVLPGMYQTLGYSAPEAASKGAAYGTDSPLPAAPPTPAPLPAQTIGGPAGTPAATSSGTPGLGSTIAKGAVGAGLSLAPAIIGAIHGGAAAGLGSGVVGSSAGIGSTAGLSALSATGIGAAVAGAGLLTAYLWKKSQVHPTADKWVQGEQNPFDQKMAGVDQAVKAGQMTPEQAAQVKKTNAQTYLQELNNFAGQGGKEAQVAAQAMATFKQYYGDPAQYA